MEKAHVASVCGSLAFLALRKALGPATKSFDASGGKTVLVTGGSSGIGLSIALSYARQGARLVLTARSADALESARAAAVAEGAADVVVVAADVATAEGRAAVVAATERFCGPAVVQTGVQPMRALEGQWTPWRSCRTRRRLPRSS